MAIERTLSIIKPDAVAKNVIGQIVARFDQAGLTVVAAQLRQLWRGEGERFYVVGRSYVEPRTGVRPHLPEIIPHQVLVSRRR